MTRVEALKIYLDRQSKDNLYDWKVPISFYGKVVDESNQAVRNAKIHYSWNTLGVPGGSLTADTSSDGGGLFSLTGQRGKLLEVTVEKQGYYPIANGNGRMDFEYADPSSHDWYEPNLNSPVVFHLRKKGLSAAVLLHWTNSQIMDSQMKATFDLKTGHASVGQSAGLVVQVSQNQDTEFAPDTGKECQEFGWGR